MKHTTLNEIKQQHPCNDGWEILLASLNKILADDEPLSFKHILKSNGIKDAVWALCVLDYKDQALFRADIAELVLPIFEEKYPDDDRPRKAVEAARDFYHGKIDEEQLINAYDSARDAANAVRVTDYGPCAIRYAAYSALFAISHSSYGSYDVVAHGGDAYTDTGTSEYWVKVEQLFIKHYC